jgi:hypothetical protein
MKRLLLFVALVLGLAGNTSGIARIAAPAEAADPPDTYVTSWDKVASDAFTASGLTPVEGHTIYAYLAIAEYDSVVAVKGGYEPFTIEVHAPHASAEAAVAAAAHVVLNKLLPNQAAGIIDPAYATSLASIPDGNAKTDGVQLGEYVANTLLAMRRNDGFRASLTYRAPNPPIPGVWLPTAPTPPIGPYLGLMEPFSLPSADVFRPAGPPSLDSQRWEADYYETRDIGGRASLTRTPAQTVAAQFWAEAPVQQAHGSLRRFIAERNLDIMQASRFMGMMSVTFADGLIACFDAKYKYAFWRPITAIQASRDDASEPTWLPLLAATPNHPEYPSAHSCITPASGLVIARFLGTNNINFTIPSLTGLGDRYYATTDQLSTEVGEARIWGGIHFRSAVEDGKEIGRKTVDQVLSQHFRKTSN